MIPHASTLHITIHQILIPSSRIQYHYTWRLPCQNNHSMSWYLCTPIIVLAQNPPCVSYTTFFQQAMSKIRFDAQHVPLTLLYALLKPPQVTSWRQLNALANCPTLSQLPYPFSTFSVDQITSAASNSAHHSSAPTTSSNTLSLVNWNGVYDQLLIRLKYSLQSLPISRRNMALHFLVRHIRIHGDRDLALGHCRSVSVDSSVSILDTWRT